MDSLSVATTTSGQAVAIHLLPFSRRSIVVKRLAGSPKELKLIPTCSINKVTIDRTPNQMPLLSYLLLPLRWSLPKELELIRTRSTLTKVLPR
jgi:hypothetical protein